MKLNLATLPSTSFYMSAEAQHLAFGVQLRTQTHQRLAGLDIIRAQHQAENLFGLEPSEHFSTLMDQLAAGTNKRGWIEKTPGHVFDLATIRSENPEARIIHILRPPEPVVRSIVRRSKDMKNPATAAYQADQLNGERLWRHAITASLNGWQSGDELILYDTFVRRADDVVAQLAKNVGVKIVEPTKEQEAETANRVIAAKEEAWKGDVRKPVGVIHHENDIVLGPLQESTVELWAQVESAIQDMGLALV